MKNVVIEIDGVRHKLVDTKDYDRCYTCSLGDLCGEAWEQSMDCTICGSLGISSHRRFELEAK